MRIASPSSHIDYDTESTALEIVNGDADWMAAVAAVAYGAGRDADSCDSVPQWVEQSYLASRRKDNA